MDLVTWLWLAIIGSGIVLEIYALLNRKPGDTLSEHVWRWFKIAPREDGDSPSPKVRALRIALLSFMAWLTVHFLTGGGFV